MPTSTLRIGICGCTSRYHSFFAGKQITLENSPGKPFARPLLFHLEECVIPEKDQRAAIVDAGIHFFVDAHQFLSEGNRTRFFGHIARVYPITEKGGVRKLYIGSPVVRVNGKRKWMSIGWSRSRTPSGKLMLSGLQKLLERMSEKQLTHWLSTVSQNRSRKPTQE